MAASLKASSQGLKLVDDARNKKGWNKYDEAWCGLVPTSEATLKRFWQGVNISKDTFVSICDAVGLSWEKVVDTSENHKISSHNCFAIIKQGVCVWNKWRQNNYDYRVNLNGIDLRGYDLSNIDLRDVSLKGADLSEVNFSHADLSEANLVNANLRNANFRNANLSRLQALGTDFTGAKLTGSCLEDWNINIETNFKNVSCDYIYLRQDQGERRPSDPNRIFEPGEFANLVQKSLNTIDLIFSKGVDWNAIAYSIRNTQVLNEDTPLAVQSIENKGDGVVLIKVNVPENADKSKIEGDFWQGYDFANKTLKEQYEARLLDKDKHINQLFNSLILVQEKLGELPKLMSEKTTVEQTFNAPIHAASGSVIGNSSMYISLEQKRTLAEAAAEIQALLQQLEHTYPNKSISEQMIFTGKAIENIENNATLKQKLINVAKEFGMSALEEAIDDISISTTLTAAIEEWQEEEIE